jgi:arginine N-succinyltransferase
MMQFRPATYEDIEAIAKLTHKAEAGMTTVPRSHAEVETSITETLKGLNGEACERFLFVTEREAGCGDILGISAIIPRLGQTRPFYSFKRSRHTRISQVPRLSVTYETLQLTTEFDGCTELATLYLSPEARGTGAARLLSLGRLAFIYQHRQAFETRLMADIRGWVDTTGDPPFWRHVASKFVAMSFDEADRLSQSHGHFIDQVLPNVPILLNLLPDEAVACVGRPNAGALPAVRLLEGVGFQRTDLSDVFDGGPSLICDTDKTLIARTAIKVNPNANSTSKDQTAEAVLAFRGHGMSFRCEITKGDLSKAKLTKGHGLGEGEDIYMAALNSGQTPVALGAL